MGSTRRLVIAGAVGFAAMAITAGTLAGGGDAPATTGALDSDESITAPAESPSTTVALPTPEPESTEPAPQPPRPAVAPGPVDPAPAPAPVEPDAPGVQLPLNPVPLPDRTGPAIANLRFWGCVVAADVTDPAGVGPVTLSWSGVPEPGFPGQWIREPGSARMHLGDGDRFQAGRGHSYPGEVFTVTAIDRTLVGNRSSQSITFNWNLDPC